MAESGSQKPMSRRDFLRLTTLTAAAAATTLLPSCTLPPEPSPVESPGRPSTPETIKQAEVDCVVEWQQGRQIINQVVDPNTGEVKYVKSCGQPILSEPGKGVVVDRTKFDWTDKTDRLARVDINNRAYPVLSALPLLPSLIDEAELVQEELRGIRKLHQNPGYIEAEIDQKIRDNQLEFKPSQPLKVLFVQLDFFKNRYYVSDGPSGHLLEDKSTQYSAAILQQELVQDLAEASGGQITFEVKASRVAQETELPFTTNPSRAPLELIKAYKQVVDYSILANWAKEAGADHVFVWGNPTTGMGESEQWNGVWIFGFNCECGAEYSLESFCHFLEKKVWNSDYDPYYWLWAGRVLESDTLPYYFDVKSQEKEMAKQIFAAAGWGTVHLPHNALGHYHYDSKLKVFLPGENEPTDCSPWGGNHREYLKWWLSKMPKAFFSVLS